MFSFLYEVFNFFLVYKISVDLDISLYLKCITLYFIILSDIEKYNFFVFNLFLKWLKLMLSFYTQ